MSGNIRLLFLLLRKYTCSVFKVIGIRLRKHCLAADFYVAFALIATHFMFFTHVNHNICVPSFTSCILASGYQRYTSYYCPALGLFGLLLGGSKLVETKQTLPFASFLHAYINLISSPLCLLVYQYFQKILSNIRFKKNKMALNEVNNNSFLEDFKSDNIIQQELHRTQLWDEVDNDGFLKGFESDSIIQQNLQSKSKSELEVCWVWAILDKNALAFLIIWNIIEECFSF